MKSTCLPHAGCVLCGSPSATEQGRESVSFSCVMMRASPGGGCGPPRGMPETGRGGPARVRGDVKLQYSAGVTLKIPVPNEP